MVSLPLGLTIHDALVFAAALFSFLATIVASLNQAFMKRRVQPTMEKIEVNVNGRLTEALEFITKLRKRYPEIADEVQQSEDHRRDTERKVAEVKPIIEKAVEKVVQEKLQSDPDAKP